MSLDPSLKVKGALTRHRNVLTRSERVEKLKEDEKWEAGASVLGLPKVAHRKSHAGRKAAKEEAAVAAVEGAVPGATATVPGAAAGAKPAAGAAKPGAAAAPAKPGAAPAGKPAAKPAAKSGKK